MFSWHFFLILLTIFIIYYFSVVLGYHIFVFLAIIILLMFYSAYKLFFLVKDYTNSWKIGAFFIFFFFILIYIGWSLNWHTLGLFYFFKLVKCLGRWGRDFLFFFK